ncbi:hypothetical protein AX289_22400 [Methylorubrum populi]|nr:hypothetical protein AX289_22400 [Methylorubrum populi]
MKHARAMWGLAAFMAITPIAAHSETVTPVLAPVSNGSMSAAGPSQSANVGSRSQAGFDRLTSWCRRTGRSSNETEACIRAVH